MPLKAFFKLYLSFFLIFSFTFQTAFAQYLELQNNANIPWIAEFSMDHDFAVNKESFPTDVVKLTKFYSDPSTMQNAKSENFIIRHVLENAFKGHSECFKDAELTQKLPIEELKFSTTAVDTVITFYPETFEETVQIVKKELDVSTIKKLRTKQIIFYNKKSGDFQTKIVAVAPLTEISPTAVPSPLVWIKMDANFPGNFNIHDPNISWGALIDTKGNPLDLDLLKIIKNENKLDFNLFIQQQALNLEKPVESSQGYGWGRFLNKKEVAHLYNCIDTIITFDPNTFQETVEIKKYDIDQKYISNVRLVQEWYFDAEKHQLINRLKAVAPLFYIGDENGVIKYVKDGDRRYAKPLYFIRYN